MSYASIVGTGHYLPSTILSNDDLQRKVDTSDEWIMQRTGIKERRVARDGEATSTMATSASRAALEAAGMSADELDLIILATVTADERFPSTACHVQRELGATYATAFDISAACSGFIYGLRIANDAIRAGSAQNALVIGAEHLTSIVDYTHRETCVLFGDGAGAAVVKARDDLGIVGVHTFTDGNLASLLRCDVGKAIEMDGKKTYRNARLKLYDAVETVVLKYHDLLEGKAIKLCIPHQANQRITEEVHSMIRANNLPHTAGMQMYSNIRHTGNTSAASIPIALDQAINERVLLKGDYALLAAFGAGATWGSVLFRY